VPTGRRLGGVVVIVFATGTKSLGFVLGVPAGNFQKYLVDESGMMGTHNRPEMVAVYGTSCVITTP
jgi:hypothetical protein